MLRLGGRMTPSLRRALFILPLWAIASIWMWSWWIGSEQERFMSLYVPLTLALLYEFMVLPSVFLYFVIRAKKPKRRIAQRDKKVAVISLCVPSSESIDIVENQLRAMSEITYPHDSWILDEGNHPEIKNLAKKYGVKHFSRKGIDKYNQLTPPFQKKTKAGNVNAWLKHVKRRKYDYFVQLDIDHIPKPNYLHKTLGYFRDPTIAWVQAPSVYKNLDNWTSRGAAEQELVLQGPLQMGFYGHSNTPFIIGSHCTYRMSAIREIGGFQPTRAEDHLDTVYLAHNGYKGVFLPEIIAEGDGPETLNTYLAQQFAWAYSMFQVLLGHTPKLLRAMPSKKRWQFMFAQTWYPLWSLSYLVLFMSPILALWAGRNIADVEPLEMLTRFGPVFVGGFFIWWASRPIMQPSNVSLSWRGMILHAVRWPIIFRAIIAATFKIKKPYMITPKGKFALMAPTLKTYQPFLALGMLSVLTVSLTLALDAQTTPKAQLVFAITNGIFMLSVCAVDIGLRLRQARPKLAELKQYWIKPIVATGSLAVAIVISINLSVSTVQSQQVLADSQQQQNATMTIPRPVSYDMTTEDLIEQIALVPVNESKEPTLGMYIDTFNTPEVKETYIQHLFVDWRDDHYLAYALAKSLQADNIPLITIEPHGDNDGAKLLDDISLGIYDDRLEKLSSSLSASNNKVYIRFAHEMELTNLYPWGNKNPQKYIDAYRYVANILKFKNSENIKMVWSPAGNIGAEVYYPGDEYADVIGTTVLYDEYWYGSNWLPSFLNISQSRQWLKYYNKPVWVVEFGTGRANRANQLQLISDAIDNFQNFGFEKLIYINLIDANIVGPDYRLKSINDFGGFFKINPEPLPGTYITNPESVLVNSPCIAGALINEIASFKHENNTLQNKQNQEIDCTVILEG